MLRTLLFATAALAAYAVALSPGGMISSPPGEAPAGTEELLDYLEGSTGTGTRRKGLDPGEASIMARVLVGEAAGQSEAEVRAIARVIFNRAQRARGGLLGALLHNRRKTWAFTCLDSARSNVELVWGAHVPRSKEFRRMRTLIDQEWQARANHSFTHYWHPKSMKPTGATPRWAAGRTATRIGDAMFLTINDGG